MKNRILFVLVSLLVISLSACGPSGDIEDEVAQAVAATQTKQAWNAAVESAQLTAEAEESAPPESEQSEDLSGPAATAEPEDTPQPAIVHAVFPDTPAEKDNSFVTDFNSSDFAVEGFTYGDQFIINRYERPFTREMLEYRGYLDIIRANLKFNPPWFYIQIFLAQPLPETSSALYAVELDLDRDDRGDILILGPQPPGEEWTVDGVTVLEDSNEDVGGEQPLLTEMLPESQPGDGYDRILFQGGLGEDPDLAWIRLNPEDPTSLEIAFKVELAPAGGFLWVVWADEGLQDPGLADYNDRFSFEEAGSPYPDHRYHPIQEINLVDSTCRSWYGPEPVGDEIGICQIYEPGEGYRLCYRVTDTFTFCNDICAPVCPEDLPDQWFCEPCTLPE